MIYWTTETDFNYDKERWYTRLLYSFDQVNYHSITGMLHDDKQIPDDVLQYFERKKLEFQNQLK